MKLLQKLKGKLDMKHVKSLLRSALMIGSVVTIGLCAMKLPEIQNKYYRAKVGSKVYEIRDSRDSGGGTGFAVKAPSGESFILTNHHVCEVSSDRETVLVVGDQGAMRRHILAIDPNSDLCLIEGIPGVEGLSLASAEPELGDLINVVGHPLLMPKHVSTGEMIGHEDVTILWGYIGVLNPDTHEWEQIDPTEGGMLPEQCTGGKLSQQVIDIDFMMFVLKVKVCIMTVQDAYNTTVTIHPGNSGSPVVNFWGNVVGVAFAGTSNTNWGYMVSLKDVKAFLKHF